VTFRLGLQIPLFDYPGVPDDRLFERIADIARTAESSGFDSIWVMDHFYQIAGPPSGRMFEAYALLSAIAGRTERAKLGALVTGVTYRNPALLAKTVTTLDVVSGGRAILGLGAAWNQVEHEGYGFDFPEVPERMERLEEAARICRLMFTEETPSFEGKHYRIHEALNRPRPVSSGGPPIMIGGSGEKKTLKLVARYADICNLFGDAATLRHKLAVLDRHCEDAGRDPKEIWRTNLKTVLIAPTKEQADARVSDLAGRWGVDEERARAIVLAGGPDDVADEMRALVDTGLNGVIVNLTDAYDLESVARAGETLSKLF
jgi:F420-dependent oxidoreductase-like protein